MIDTQKNPSVNENQIEGVNGSFELKHQKQDSFKKRLLLDMSCVLP